MTDDDLHGGETEGSLPDAAEALLDLLGGTASAAPGWGPAAVAGDGGSSSTPATAFGSVATGVDEVPPVVGAPVFGLPDTHERDDLEQLWQADAAGGSALHVTTGLDGFVAAPGAF